MKQQCQGCEYLDTSKKQMVGQAYRYGCGLRTEGYISTWINTDRLLSQINCTVPKSEDETTEQTVDALQGQMTIDEWLGA